MLLVRVTGSTRATFTRKNTPFSTGSKRRSLVASVPTTVIWPETGLTATAMQMFMRRLGVTDLEGVGVNDRQVAVGQVPSRNAARGGCIGAGNPFCPIGVVVIEPTVG